jgi:hypothetical protein
MKTVMSCVDCNADFSIQHSMDDDYYRPRFCVFCGTEIFNEEDDSSIDEEEYDDDLF